MQAVQVFRTDGECTEIPANLNPANRIPEFQVIDNNLATREEYKGTTGGNETTEITNTLSKRTCNVHRESCGNLHSSHTSSTTLQNALESVFPENNPLWCTNLR